MRMKNDGEKNKTDERDDGYLLLRSVYKWMSEK